MISSLLVIFSIIIFQKKRKTMSVESEMLKYINLARQFPTYFVSIIDKQLATFINEKEMPISQEIIYQTNEGKGAWREARIFLEKQVALPRFELHQGLGSSAKDHALDLAQHGAFGHTGSDKSTFSERILRYCKKGQGSMAEIIGADFLLKNRNNAEMTILGLIVDDGVVDRGHRKTIFNPEYRFIGCKSEIQNDKLITVFNITQNKLQLRNANSTISSDVNYNYSVTSPSKMNYKKQQSQPSGSHLNLSKSSPYPSENNQIDYLKQTERSAFDELNKNVSVMKSPKKTMKTSFHSSDIGKDGKKITEKKENTHIYFEDNCKVTQTVIKIYYSDGTMEEKTDRHTIFN